MQLVDGNGNSAVKGVQCECRGRHGTNTNRARCDLANCCRIARRGCPGAMPDAFARQVRSAEQDESLTAVTKYAQLNEGMESWLADFIPTWTKCI